VAATDLVIGAPLRVEGDRIGSGCLQWLCDAQARLFAACDRPLGDVSPQTAVNLPYQSSCASAAGWHYDDPSQPTKVTLCEGSCNTIKADPLAKLSIAFVCERVIQLE
jgi:hypothetical protein